jgi:hypothetical protein
MLQDTLHAASGHETENLVPSTLVAAAIVMYALYCSQQLRMFDVFVLGLAQAIDAAARHTLFDLVFVLYLASLLYIDCIAPASWRMLFAALWLVLCSQFNPVVYSTMPSGLADYALGLGLALALCLYTRAHLLLDFWTLCFKISWFFLVDWGQIILVPLGRSRMHPASAAVLLVASSLVVLNMVWLCHSRLPRDIHLLPVRIQPAYSPMPARNTPAPPEQDLGGACTEEHTESRPANKSEPQRRRSQRHSAETDTQYTHGTHSSIPASQYAYPHMQYQPGIFYGVPTTLANPMFKIQHVDTDPVQPVYRSVSEYKTE